MIVRCLLLVLSVLSVPAAAEELNQPLPCVSDDNFYPMGNRWVRDPAADRPEILMYHSAEGPTRTGNEQISPELSRDAFASAFATWADARCTSTKRPNIQVSVEPGLFSGENGGDQVVGGQLVSSINLVSWEGADDEGVLDAGTVGITVASYYRETGFVVDADIILNDRDYQWRVQQNGSNLGCSRTETGCYDIESVALHEAGHFFGLGHIRCGDAVMFPEGTGTGTAVGLSPHEINGICSLYPPRDPGVTTTSDTWEACTGDGNCPQGTSCVKPLGSTQYGYCAPNCLSGADCGEGFVCATEAIGLTGATSSFCRPGIEDINEVGGLCSLCASGSDCLSGLCIGDGSRSYCTERCGPEGQCAEGFTCLELNDGTQGCWPESPTTCADENFGDLNELCLQGQDVLNPTFYNPCGPGLVCFAFKPRCSITQGTCMLYCDADNPCADPNLSCCYGVDQSGNCLGPSAERRFGGCFDLRTEGENCSAPEQSICGPGQGCFFFEQETLAECYQRCSTDAECGLDQACQTFQDQACDESFGLCCQRGEPGCVPADGESGQALGTLCRSNSDCDSGVCLTYGNASACSRTCEALTQVGCPEGSDVDGDGQFDLEFTCIEGLEADFCWPNGGAVAPPGGGSADDTESDSGCTCSGSGGGTGPWAWLLLGWLVLRCTRRLRQTT
ncbi:MAG: matrixin family metalloprotease [Myxococcota bacterium]|nr:matrixin family metalloprotease [Myxococcota bacterium]